MVRLYSVVAPEVVPWVALLPVKSIREHPTDSEWSTAFRAPRKVGLEIGQSWMPRFQVVPSEYEDPLRLQGRQLRRPRLPDVEGDGFDPRRQRFRARPEVLRHDTLKALRGRQPFRPTRSDVARSTQYEAARLYLRQRVNWHPRGWSQFLTTDA